MPWRSFCDVLDSQKFHVCPHQSRHRATLSRWWGRSLPSLMTCAHTQELQRTLPGARRITFADESGVKLWARSQLDKAIDGDAAAHEQKSRLIFLSAACKFWAHLCNPMATVLKMNPRCNHYP